MVVDRTDFHMQESFPFTKEVDRKWYNWNFKSAAFRWEVETVYKTGDTCWFNGPYPAGLMPDLCMFRLNLK